MLEENWQKAERELVFVDHLVERIRKVNSWLLYGLRTISAISYFINIMALIV